MEGRLLRKKFLDFFAARGHAIVPSSSLIPSDPSVLLTTAGMQQFKPYYTGEADPVRDFGSKNTASIQKSFRTSDIDEVGDDTHLTFFEMLGNFSFGYKPGEPSSPKDGYWKKKAISYAYEFITKELGLTIAYVTVFRGEYGVPKDEESAAIWKSLGVVDVREEGMEDVFWGPTGTSGPCGPTTEIYCMNAAGEAVEIWNIVFNEFFSVGSRDALLTGNTELKPLETKGIDTGMGLERLLMIAQKERDIFETDLFAPFIELMPPALDIRTKRIIADHIRGSIFLIADGVRPSNKDAGYILRRLMRRVLTYAHLENLPLHLIDALIHDMVHDYGDWYLELMTASEAIRTVFGEEREKFGKTLERGLKELSKIEAINAEIAFQLYETYGLPFEIIREIGAERAKTLSRKAFDAEFKKHQEVSRAGQEKKFGGHGLVLDTGELKAGNEEELKIVTRLHTATHLLNAALHKVLGDSVTQQGSDITAERTRFDFSFPRKLVPEEIKNIENIVNTAIKEDYSVVFQEMDTVDAKSSGALFVPKAKYPARVKVYSVGRGTDIFSRELCGGPHVTRTSEIGHFRIAKEEASSAGIRRIRGVIDKN